MNKAPKFGRKLMVTVNELLQSPRLRIAIENFDTDRQLLKAILVELGMGAQTVAKNKIIKTYATHSSLAQFEMVPLLRSINTFDKYELYWGMSELEQQLYCTDAKFQLTKEERLELQDKVRKRFMGN